VYDAGWDQLRCARAERMQAAGLFQTDFPIAPRDGSVHPWADEPHPAWQAHKMAVYAAMVDRMDQSIGRLVAALKRLGQFDNTLILFLSDNGGCAEFMAEDGWCKFFPDRLPDGRQVVMGNRPDVWPGDALTFQSYDRPWANLSNAPFRKYKHYVHEGGISTPLIAHWPAGGIASGIIHEIAHVVDLVPTILEATGCSYLAECGGHAIQPAQGQSLLDVLRGLSKPREMPIFFEHEGNSAVRSGPFKLVRLHDGPWELYDMEVDRAELGDLAGRNKPVARNLERLYQEWASGQGVMSWNRLAPRLLAAWQLEGVAG
ncbi:MAG: sulfatase-like hydrolase/transferase, partial [Pseudomonadota bacterium]